MSTSTSTQLPTGASVVVAQGRPLARMAGLLFGGLTQSLFVYTAWRLFWFLKEGRGAEASGSLWIDAALALQFVVPHSLLLLPPVKQRLKRWIAMEFYGLFFCVVTCTSALTAMTFWEVRGPDVWNLTGAAGSAMTACFYASWVGLFYCVYLNGPGYQTGLTEWNYWRRRAPVPRRPFQPRAAYMVMRHPMYLSFLGLIWFTPRMTADHALLTGIWTAYVFVGSYLKDRRLLFYLGDVYRDYARRVPGYPLMPFGPLARMPAASTGAASAAHPKAAA